MLYVCVAVVSPNLSHLVESLPLYLHSLAQCHPTPTPPLSFTWTSLPPSPPPHLQYLSTISIAAGPTYPQYRRWHRTISYHTASPPFHNATRPPPVVVVFVFGGVGRSMHDAPYMMTPHRSAPSLAPVLPPSLLPSLGQFDLQAFLIVVTMVGVQGSAALGPPCGTCASSPFPLAALLHVFLPGAPRARRPAIRTSTFPRLPRLQSRLPTPLHCSPSVWP